MIYSSFPIIGIVGLGFVGSAVRESYSGFSDLVLIDPDPQKYCSHKYSDLLKCEGVFICVPSPALPDGSCDTTILEDVLSHLKDYNGVIISKVTAPPDVYTRLSKQYKNLVHVPEFLTAANATQDYISAEFMIVGGTVQAYMHEAERIIHIGQTKCKNAVHCSIEEASLTKYAINSFLATKVVFMNELYQLATANGLQYDHIRKMMQLDHRIGKSHNVVPGADGHGFSGMCFPKDTEAFLKFASDSGVDLSVLEAATKKNTLLRLIQTS